MASRFLDSLAPLRRPHYRSAFLANAVSTFGDQVVPVALAFAVLEATGSASALGLVLLARTLRLALFVLTGGSCTSPSAVTAEARSVCVDPARC